MHPPLDPSTDRTGGLSLGTFLGPHDRPIRSVRPSAWTGHIPFLFCLVASHRPARFVELGTHHGASFLAACQAVDDEGLPTECIAVDTWQGDEHAGAYGEEVYEEVVRELDRCGYDFASLSRKLFDEAARDFAEASIDLLHIDGLHTYEAVRHDHDTWWPKLTDDAVVLYHDTNVHERGFGVWRFFDELAREHLTYSFRHTHGLGVLVRDGAEDTAIGQLVRRLRDEPEFASLFEALFQHAGGRAAAEARLAADRTVLGGEPADVRQRLDALTEEIPTLRSALAEQQEQSARLEREVERLRVAEDAARSDLVWLLDRFDQAPTGLLLRRLSGFRRLTARWLDDRT